MLGRTKAALGAAALIAVSAIWLAAPERVQVLAGLNGPTGHTTISPAEPTPWTAYRAAGSTAASASQLAILLTDEEGAWLGLARGLKSIGVPFIITTDVAAAARHQVVMIYPIVSGRVLSPDALRTLAAVPGRGGTLIGTNVLGGMQTTFGVAEARPSQRRFELRFVADQLEPLGLVDPLERTLRLGNHRESPTTFGTYGYVGTSALALATFEDGTAAITQRSVGPGKAYAFGVDLGALLSKGYNNREENIASTYVNGFEPNLDVLLRLIRKIYREGGPATAVTLGTVPQGKRLAVILTHDIDYAQSLENAVVYAEYEKSQGIRATYFMQTKYVRDWNDETMLNDVAVSLLRKLRHELGMEVASHSVSHSRQFASFPLGSGDETYPAYRPFVRSLTQTVGGTVLGELRVSKFLLEALGASAQVKSFRPGYLSNPYTLPQALSAVGFSYSSSVTANNSLTHLPFRLTRDRDNISETDVFEFPVTIEDEAEPPLVERLPEALALAEKIGRQGGAFVVLIHPDTLGQKLAFERALVEALKPTSWFGALEDYGAWWAARDQIAIEVAEEAGGPIVRLSAPLAIEGLPLETPTGWQLVGTDPPDLRLARTASGFLLERAQGMVELRFQVHR